MRASVERMPIPRFSSGRHQRVHFGVRRIGPTDGDLEGLRGWPGVPGPSQERRLPPRIRFREARFLSLPGGQEEGEEVVGQTAVLPDPSVNPLMESLSLPLEKDAR